VAKIFQLSEMSAYDKFDKWVDDYASPTDGDVRPKLNGPEDLRFIPLFSNVLDDDPNNAAAQAIRAMQEDTSPSERAEALKNSGNKAYQLGEERNLVDISQKSLCFGGKGKKAYLFVNCLASKKLTFAFILFFCFAKKKS
jgi:hypothetical protein